MTQLSLLDPPPAQQADTIDYALTLTQPWAALVASGIKRIENRPWKLPQKMLGRRFAIHASREVDKDVLRHLIEHFGLDDSPLWHVTGAIIGVARATGFVSSLDELEQRLGGCVSGDPADQRIAIMQQMRFWIGPHAFLLDEISALEKPIECKGALSFWGLSEVLQKPIYEQLAA